VLYEFCSVCETQAFLSVLSVIFPAHLQRSALKFRPLRGRNLPQRRLRRRCGMRFAPQTAARRACAPIPAFSHETSPESI